MIVKTLMNLVYKILSLVLSPLNISGFPEGTAESVDSFFDMLFSSAESVIGLLVPTITFVLLGIILAVEVASHLIPFIMWILRKIPFLGIN